MHFIKKINWGIAAACYCALMCLIVVITSLPYGARGEGTAQSAVDFSKGWTVYADDKQLATDASLPFVLDNKDLLHIEIRNQIPPLPFAVSMLETMIFQRDFAVYVDGTLVSEKVFSQKYFNQDTPGSGRVFVQLPQDSAGKEIVIKMYKAVPQDESAIAQIRIMDGVLNERNIVSLSGSAFVATILMFFVGVCLLITSIVYVCGGIKIYSLCSMSMFVITSSLWVMCNSKVLQFFTDNWVLMHNLEYMAFYSTPLWLWIFLYYNWEKHAKTCKVAITILTVFSMAVLTAKVFGICDFYASLRIYHALALGNIVVILILGIKEFRRQSKALKIFFLGIACLCLTSCLDLVRYYTLFSPDAMAVFFIFGVIFMGFCLFFTFIIMTKDSFTATVQANIYKEMAFSDILTGLQSRTKWEKDIADIQNRPGSYTTVTAVMIDVNKLKRMNDQYGHHTGDQMLIAVADTLKTRFAGIASTYRLGGDEFCVIALNQNEADIKPILAQMDAELQAIPFAETVSVAWGCASCQHGTCTDINALIREADNRMYESKRKMKECAAPACQ